MRPDQTAAQSTADLEAARQSSRRQFRHLRSVQTDRQETANPIAAARRNTVIFASCRKLDQRKATQVRRTGSLTVTSDEGHKRQ